MTIYDFHRAGRVSWYVTGCCRLRITGRSHSRTVCWTPGAPPPPGPRPSCCGRAACRQPAANSRVKTRPCSCECPHLRAPPRESGGAPGGEQLGPGAGVLVQVGAGGGPVQEGGQRPRQHVPLAPAPPGGPARSALLRHLHICIRLVLLK